MPALGNRKTNYLYLSTPSQILSSEKNEKLSTSDQRFTSLKTHGMITWILPSPALSAYTAKHNREVSKGWNERLIKKT